MRLALTDNEREMFGHLKQMMQRMRYFADDPFLKPEWDNAWVKLMCGLDLPVTQQHMEGPLMKVMQSRGEDDYDFDPVMREEYEAVWRKASEGYT